MEEDNYHEKQELITNYMNYVHQFFVDLAIYGKGVPGG